MGETWSVPALAFVDRNTMRADDGTKKATATTRKPKGNDFVLYVGSGYGATGEGTSFYSIDPLTGDIITRVEVNSYATTNFPTLNRTGMPYANALVANPVVFNASRFLFAPGGVKSPNVAAAPGTPRLHRRSLGPAVEVPDGRSRQAAPRGRPRRQPAGGDCELAARLARERPCGQAVPVRDLGQRQPCDPAVQELRLPRRRHRHLADGVWHR